MLLLPLLAEGVGEFLLTGSSSLGGQTALPLCEDDASHKKVKVECVESRGPFFKKPRFF